MSDDIIFQNKPDYTFIKDWVLEAVAGLPEAKWKDAVYRELREIKKRQGIKSQDHLYYDEYRSFYKSCSNCVNRLLDQWKLETSANSELENVARKIKDGVIREVRIVAEQNGFSECELFEAVARALKNQVAK